MPKVDWKLPRLVVVVVVVVVHTLLILFPGQLPGPTEEEKNEACRHKDLGGTTDENVCEPRVPDGLT